MHSSDGSETSIGGISRDRIVELRETEGAAFRKARPKSQAKVSNGLPGFFGGVPMHWMNDWPTPFPILVDSAKGAAITDIDGNRLDDFCLGDTGSMFGHSPPPVARAIRRQAGRGLTYMLPSEDALAIGPLLQQRFGLPFWQIATTATAGSRTPAASTSCAQAGGRRPSPTVSRHPTRLRTMLWQKASARTVATSTPVASRSQPSSWR